MTVQRADPGARRQALILIGAAALLGTLLLLGFERYGESLRDWVLSDPEQSRSRLRLLFILFAAGASAPLLAFGGYLWVLGHKIVRAKQFPPPGQRVVRDTEVVEGEAATARGRALKVFAVVLCAFCIMFWMLLWRIAAFIRSG
jgi:hypothetical protein